MTIFVNELVVKGTIADPDDKKASRPSRKRERADRQEIIEACVEEVLRIRTGEKGAEAI